MENHALFKAKSKTTNEWIEGYYAKGNYWLDESETHIILKSDTVLFPHGEISGWEEVYPSTVSQYVGMTDRNGKKIFEGDIIKGKFYFGRGYRLAIGVVTYFDCGFKVKIGNDYKNLPYSHDCQIIGNLSENPELIQS